MIYYPSHDPNLTKYDDMNDKGGKIISKILFHTQSPEGEMVSSNGMSS